MDIPKLLEIKKSLLSQLERLFCVYSSFTVLILLSFHKMMLSGQQEEKKKTLGKYRKSSEIKVFQENVKEDHKYMDNAKITI